MDLSFPISSAIPGGHGAVLHVLARTSEPLSGRRIAELTQGRLGQRRVNDVLRELAFAGIAIREVRPPAHLYVLNRDHVAAPGIVLLAGMWDELLRRITAELEGWEAPAYAAYVFGSAARRDGESASDVDLLLVRKGQPDGPEDAEWEAQVDRLTHLVERWSGNACEVLVLELEALRSADRAGRRLILDLRRDAIPVVGPDFRRLLRETAVRS